VVLAEVALADHHRRYICRLLAGMNAAHTRFCRGQGRVPPVREEMRADRDDHGALARAPHLERVGVRLLAAFLGEAEYAA
jgi:hypothetical protein